MDLSKRRLNQRLITPMESKLYTAMDELDALRYEAPDKRLEEAVDLIDQAAEKISDYMDDKIKEAL